MNIVRVFHVRVFHVRVFHVRVFHVRVFHVRVYVHACTCTRVRARVFQTTVKVDGVNISLTKPIWKLSNDKSVRLRYFVKRNSMLLLYCCDHHYDLCFTISSLPFLNCMGRAVILAL